MISCTVLFSCHYKCELSLPDKSILHNMSRYFCVAFLPLQAYASMDWQNATAKNLNTAILYTYNDIKILFLQYLKMCLCI